jgi:hypothetical protein
VRSTFLIVAAGIAALTLAACASDTEPSPAERAAAWDAQNVPPLNYKSDVLAYMRTYLNNPVKVRDAAISPPVKKTIAGYPGDRFVSCVRYNARDDKGRYAGDKTGVAVYVNGRFDRYFDTPALVKDACKDAAFAPFPDMEKLTR